RPPGSRVRKTLLPRVIELLRLKAPQCEELPCVLESPKGKAHPGWVRMNIRILKALKRFMEE
ncbi:MAG: hypothetical protein J7M32_10420, partial [Deltaproteobacteria bacterium]|nr:hypothetical protein [Deltaproteobacteria bacterium]